MSESTLSGAWELVSDRFEGIAVMTENYFSEVIIFKDRQSYPGDQPTESEAAGLYGKIGRAVAGRMERSNGKGNELYLHSKDPKKEGTSINFGYTVDETTCSFWQINDDGSNGPSIHWIRLE